jgi:hypothetical protein
MTARTVPTKNISNEKRESIKNLYLSGIPKEFVAMQVDLSVGEVVSVLKKLGISKVQ